MIPNLAGLSSWFEFFDVDRYEKFDTNKGLIIILISFWLALLSIRHLRIRKPPVNLNLFTSYGLCSLTNPVRALR